MEQLRELLAQIRELAGIGIDALDQAIGAGGGEAGGAPAPGGEPVPQPTA